MKRIVIIAAVFMMALTATVNAEDLPLESYISGFDYAARKEMKIDSKALVKGITEGKIQLIDIRFKEEFEAWRMGAATSIPLNELPARLNELQKDKIIVTACPHKDRAIIAMTYLRTKGFNSKYLTDGLIGLAENLRGDRAKDFIHAIKK
ncbi:rhodanese-like domain-containing protein [Desulfococcaceae bacterium HSG8]|nr:rhodanese-like domain-containing protein [Desulfococcaceae bacterium HSG8]